MKQYRITTENMLFDDPNDCIISDTDPFHELKIAHHLGGLGSEQRLAEYKMKQLPTIPSKTNEEIEYGKSLKPGTDEWFKHNFSRKHL